jgi:hypothetical protein
VIKFTESPGGLETYMIKKIEFWSQPSTNWFWQVKQTYFGNNSLIETNDLHEPGPVPERKVLEKINSEMSD